MDLYLFSADPSLLESASPWVDGVLVDFEAGDKRGRQRGYDTQVNDRGDDDLALACSKHKGLVIARIEPWGTGSATQVDRLLAGGATGLMLPMATNVQQVEAFLDHVTGRALTIVQVETPALLAALPALRPLSWDHLYFGFNDLMIARGDRDLFAPLRDGTLVRCAEQLAPRRFGFGGITAVERGNPIPTIELMAHMVALDCSMTLLRRSFARDVSAAEAPQALARIRATLAELRADSDWVARLCAGFRARGPLATH